MDRQTFVHVAIRGTGRHWFLNNGEGGVVRRSAEEFALENGPVFSLLIQ